MAKRSGGAAGGKQHKRALSSASTTEATVKRPRRAKSTPTKSTYFEADDDDEDQETDGAQDDSHSEAGSASDFADEEEVAGDEAESDDPSEPESEDDEDVSRRRKTTKSSRGVKAKAKSHAKESIEWKPGVKTGLGPGNQVIIKKPKARPAGKTPYAEDTLHPNTFLFLSELKDNNKREWLKLHDPDFRQAEKDWHTFVEHMTEKLTTIDDTIPELPIKDVVFRIYRDIRFSKDPTPYKAYFSVAWSRAGRKGPFAHYYVQVAPGNSFIGGGLWHPEAAPVAALRRAIDRYPQRLKAVLQDTRIRKEFFNGAAASDKAVVKAFVSSNSENALKTKPKGYDADHADIDLLRLRNYTIGRKLADAEVIGESGRDCISQHLDTLRPFITYLNSVIMPDEADEEDEGEEDEGEEDEGEEDEGEEADEEDD